MGIVGAKRSGSASGGGEIPSQVRAAGHEQDHQQGGDDPGEQPGGGDGQPTAQGRTGGSSRLDSSCRLSCPVAHSKRRHVAPRCRNRQRRSNEGSPGLLTAGSEPQICLLFRRGERGRALHAEADCRIQLLEQTASHGLFVHMAPLLQMRLRASVEPAARWRSLFRGANVKSERTINRRLHYRVSEGGSDELALEPHVLDRKATRSRHSALGKPDPTSFARRDCPGQHAGKWHAHGGRAGRDADGGRSASDTYGGARGGARRAADRCANGDAVGLATFTENADGVTVHLLIEGLSPGEHGWHLHEFGVCDPNGDEPFSSAGGHWNPTDQPHGAPDADEHHVGDFGNLVASADGLAEVEITSTDFTFEVRCRPPSSMRTAPRSSSMKASMTSPRSRPANSGPRYACGVVAEPTIDMTAMQAATPMATPMTMATTMTMATPRSVMATPEDAAATPTP